MIKRKQIIPEVPEIQVKDAGKMKVQEIDFTRTDLQGNNWNEDHEKEDVYKD
jgi:hypothetical protein